MAKAFPPPLIPVERIASCIYVIRGKKVMSDSDLAALYQVETFNLNKAVKRNAARFPEDFMFQLSREEAENLTFQNGISSWGGRRTPPYVFTEQGVAMLSSVLRSDRAAQVNVAIIRTFVKLRERVCRMVPGRVRRNPCQARHGCLSLYM
jgi:hypothetical protein